MQLMFSIRFDSLRPRITLQMHFVPRPVTGVPRWQDNLYKDPSQQIRVEFWDMTRATTGSSRTRAAPCRRLGGDPHPEARTSLCGQLAELRRGTVTRQRLEGDRCCWPTGPRKSSKRLRGRPRRDLIQLERQRGQRDRPLARLQAAARAVHGHRRLQQEGGPRAAGSHIIPGGPVRRQSDAT